jgi:hypothetical protein
MCALSDFLLFVLIAIIAIYFLRGLVLHTAILLCRGGTLDDWAPVVGVGGVAVDFEAPCKGCGMVG